MKQRLARSATTAVVGFARNPQVLRPFAVSRYISRSYSSLPGEEALAALPDIDPSKLEVTLCKIPKDLVPPEELIFGRTFTGIYLPRFLHYLH